MSKTMKKNGVKKVITGCTPPVNKPPVTTNVSPEDNQTLWDRAVTEEWCTNLRKIVTKDKTTSVATRIGKISLEHLRLWTANPRIHSAAKSAGYEDTAELNQEQAFDLMMKPSFKVAELIIALKISRQSTDPVMATAFGDVFEGNRRLTAYKELAKGDDNEDFLDIPVEVFPPDFTAEQIRSTNDLRHTKGMILTWAPIDRARECFNKHQIDGWSVTRIAAYSTSSPEEVKTAMEAFQMVERYEELTGKSGKIHYTKFRKLYQSLKLRQRVENDASFFPYYCALIKNGKLNHCESVGALVRVLDDPKAKAILEDLGIKVAIQDLEIRNNKDIKQIGGKITSFIESIDDAQIAALSNGSSDSDDVRADLLKAMAKIKKIIERTEPPEATSV